MVIDINAIRRSLARIAESIRLHPDFVAFMRATYGHNPDVADALDFNSLNQAFTGAVMCLGVMAEGSAQSLNPNTNDDHRKLTAENREILQMMERTVAIFRQTYPSEFARSVEISIDHTPACFRPADGK